MFPGAGAQVYYNDAGEPLGWDYPSDEPYDAYDDDRWDRADAEEAQACDECGEWIDCGDELCWDCADKREEQAEAVRAENDARDLHDRLLDINDRLTEEE